MQRILWIVRGAMLVGFVFLSSPDVSQAGPPPSPNPNNNGKPATTVNPPGQTLPPGWSRFPPPFCDGAYLPNYCEPLGQRGTPPPGQAKTPPGKSVTSPGHTTDIDDIP